MRLPRSVKASENHTQALAVNVHRANFYSSFHHQLANARHYNVEWGFWISIVVKFYFIDPQKIPKVSKSYPKSYGLSLKKVLDRWKNRVLSHNRTYSPPPPQIFLKIVLDLLWRSAHESWDQLKMWLFFCKWPPKLLFSDGKINDKN